MRIRTLLPVLFAGLLLLRPVPAGAVIEIKSTVDKLFEASDPVVIGTVTKANPENGLIEVKTTETVKGKEFPEAFRVQLKNRRSW